MQIARTQTDTFELRRLPRIGKLGVGFPRRNVLEVGRRSDFGLISSGSVDGGILSFFSFLMFNTTMLQAVFLAIGIPLCVTCDTSVACRQQPLGAMAG